MVVFGTLKCFERSLMRASFASPSWALARR